MLRCWISQDGGAPLPALDLDDARVVIGSAAGAQIRLPAGAARAEHVELGPAGWRALAEAVVDGARRGAGEAGPIGGGVVIEVAGYRVRVESAPAGTSPSTAQRTASLARELVRSLLGAGAAPSLVIERGPGAGASRALAPPESALVIGRGDEADWVILDEDLSRRHVEIRRGWDGAALCDLGSKNGTRVDGRRVGAEPAPLADGAQIEVGGVALRFRDPAEQHLRGGAPERAPERPAERAAGAPERASAEAEAAPIAPAWIGVVALVIASAAVAGLVWVLAG